MHLNIIWNYKIYTFDYFRVLTQKKQYGEIILPLQAVMEVMQHFNSYMDIPQVKQLSDQVRVQVVSLISRIKYIFLNIYFFRLLKVHQIQDELAQQITADFKQAFSGQNPKHFNQLTEGCLVLSVLHPKVKYAH